MYSHYITRTLPLLAIALASCRKSPKPTPETTTTLFPADANASPPAGIEGVRQSDRGAQKHGKILFGALGFGALKLALHRACVARLFEQNDLLLDAEEIYAIAKTMVG